jgi:quercetin dioxygenase-like cupin family protein
MGILTTYHAEKKDTNGAFSLIEGTVLPGNEPPPHVHEREDELLYVLEGVFDVYVGEEAFRVETGECIFLPRSRPHTFLVRSRQLRTLCLLTPGGFEGYFRGMSSPAHSLESPPEESNYATTNLEQAVQRLAEYGVRFLSPDEIAAQLPMFPQLLPHKDKQ